MSWLRCDSCDSLIDTDEEPGAYDPQRDVWLCGSCRPAPISEVDDDPGTAEQEERDRGAADSWRFKNMKRWNFHDAG